jgi:co-chaperonin GroES (HSP10)
MKFKSCDGWFLVQVDAEKEQKTSGGIVIPGTIEPKTQRGKLANGRYIIFLRDKAIPVASEVAEHVFAVKQKHVIAYEIEVE